MSSDHSFADLLPNAMETVSHSLKRLGGRGRMLGAGLIPFLPVALIAGLLAAVTPDLRFPLGGPVEVTARSLAFSLVVPALLTIPGVLLFTAFSRALAGQPEARLWPWAPTHTKVLKRLVPLALPCMIVGVAGLPLVTIALGAVLFRFAPMLRAAALGQPMGARAAWGAFGGTWLETLLAAALLAAVAGIVAEIVLYLVSTLLPGFLATGVAAGFYGYLGALILALVLAEPEAQAPEAA